ncbi:Hypothetical protein, putative [Bodo saltans]|uniref:Transmembrane protein n=1 Tax=Bodo saltans TaxID=75058 RepID=A0A0S4JK03_BODSA|nr:Hypothetical protein, putative [Bodo saltans]|eukprot:CUG89743.1 Hypothetical protein, putative [Bodo saltans]
MDGTFEINSSPATHSCIASSWPACVTRTSCVVWLECLSTGECIVFMGRCFLTSQQQKKKETRKNYKGGNLSVIDFLLQLVFSALHFMAFVPKLRVLMMSRAPSLFFPKVVDRSVEVVIKKKIALSSEK